ncbi:peptide chain release factor N(5)-glutamine methyltransferase [Shimia sp. NS0008-38b]|uniref:peptide chain release factor N(5)-glutamine methyltransferase n=1 Tax=Shimia sp. NS0008-38b TaxID=3127653 RepID=UPI003102FEE3
MSASVQNELIQITKTLRDNGVESANTDARLLMAHVLGIEKARLTLHVHDEMTEEQAFLVNQLALDRSDRIPMSHILGYREFYGRRFTVTSAVLDPRPETETLIVEALSKPFSEVLDLGTGSGAIAVTLLAERPNATGFATDLSPGALEVAQQNAEKHDVLARLHFEESNWFSAVGGTFDLIVSNPPYIALVEMPSLAPELSYEPRIALTDEADGLTAYRKIAAGAPEHLNPNGWLMVEIGWQQGPDVAALFNDAGLQNVAVKPDLDGRDRVVVGQLG